MYVYICMHMQTHDYKYVYLCTHSQEYIHMIVFVTKQIHM